MISERAGYMSSQKMNMQDGLYSPDFEHDNCGIGAGVNIKGRKSHETWL